MSYQVKCYKVRRQPKWNCSVLEDSEALAAWFIDASEVPINLTPIHGIKPFIEEDVIERIVRKVQEVTRPGGVCELPPPPPPGVPPKKPPRPTVECVEDEIRKALMKELEEKLRLRRKVLEE